MSITRGNKIKVYKTPDIQVEFIENLSSFNANIENIIKKYRPYISKNIFMLKHFVRIMLFSLDRYDEKILLLTGQ